MHTSRATNRRGRRVLVLGAARSALAAARDLSGAGWAVGVARHASDHGPATASRHVRNVHRVNSPEHSLAAFSVDLAELVDEFAYEAILPAADDYLAGLSLVSGGVRQLVPLASAETVHTVLDKTAIEPFARAAGFEVPTRCAPGPWTGPLIVKDQSHWNPGSLPGRVEAVLARTPAELDRALANVERAGGTPLLQEPVQGVMHAATAFRSPDGTVSGHVHQTSDHLWPSPAGMTARAVTTAVDPGLASRVAALLDSLGWIGPAFLQLFRQADGTDVLIDMNGRFHHSLSLSLAAGTRYPRAWARVAAGASSVSLPDGRPNRRFSYLAGDTMRAWQERRGGLVADLAGTWTFALRAGHTLLTPTDPGPGLRFLIIRVSKRRGVRAPTRLHARPRLRSAGTVEHGCGGQHEHRTCRDPVRSHRVRVTDRTRGVP